MKWLRLEQGMQAIDFQCTQPFEWTHGPCVPTCIRTARPITHFTHQSDRYEYVGTHASGVRPHGKERPYTRLQKQMHMFIGLGARAVRPLTWKRESIYTVAGVNTRVYWSGRTSRASLHKFERFVISGAVITNDLRFAFQSHPFCTVISPISPCNMAHFTAQYGWYGKPI